MQLRRGTLYVSEWPFDSGPLLELRKAGSGECYVMASSREELELKMAAMGLETDWSSKFEHYSIWPVRRIR